MKIICFILFTVLLVSLSQKLKAQDTVHWRQDYRVNWADFKGKPDPARKMSALTFTGMGTAYFPTDSGFSFDVTCYFVRTESWTISNSEQLLQHERGHFDIAELFARRLRKELSELKFNLKTIDADLKKIHSQLETERKQMNITYDKETDFSMNGVMQKIWNDRIMKEINLLNKYQRKST